jgi:hypothetical protein
MWITLNGASPSMILYTVVTTKNNALLGVLKPVPRVEAGQSTSTTALRVVRGDKKGTQCPQDPDPR